MATFLPKNSTDLAGPLPPIPWIWEGYIARGDLDMIVAYMKRGKSTLVYPLALAISRGTAFLGAPTRRGNVLILAVEEHPRNVRKRLKKLGLAEYDNLWIHEGIIRSAPEEWEAIGKFIEKMQISVLFIDSLSYFWSVGDENDNAEVLRSMRPMLEIARALDCAIVPVHHESKYGGRDPEGGSYGDGRSIRGASALFGVLDNAILLEGRRGGTAQQRVIRTVGRYGLRETVIELWGDPNIESDNPYGYTAIGPLQRLSYVEQRAHEADLLLRTGQHEVKDLATKLGINPSTAQQALDVLTDQGRVQRTGKGVKGDPFIYGRVGQ